MATYRILGDEDMFVAVIDSVVNAGETFDVPDDVARDLAFSTEVYETVEPPTPAPTPARPKRNASTEAWLAFALEQGADPDRVANLSRDDLIAEFGDEED